MRQIRILYEYFDERNEGSRAKWGVMEHVTLNCNYKKSEGNRTIGFQ